MNETTQAPDLVGRVVELDREMAGRIGEMNAALKAIPFTDLHLGETFANGAICAGLVAEDQARQLHENARIAAETRGAADGYRRLAAEQPLIAASWNTQAERRDAAALSAARDAEGNYFSAVNAIITAREFVQMYLSE